LFLADKRTIPAKREIRRGASRLSFGDDKDGGSADGASRSFTRVVDSSATRAIDLPSSAPPFDQFRYRQRFWQSR